MAAYGIARDPPDPMGTELLLVGRLGTRQAHRGAAAPPWGRPTEPPCPQSPTFLERANGARLISRPRDLWDASEPAPKAPSAPPRSLWIPKLIPPTPTTPLTVTPRTPKPQNQAGNRDPKSAPMTPYPKPGAPFTAPPITTTPITHSPPKTTLPTTTTPIMGSPHRHEPPKPRPHKP